MTSSKVLDIPDSGRRRVDAEFLLGGRNSWNNQDTVARLAKQMIDRNRGLLSDFGVDADVTYYGQSVSLDLRSGTTVGALPLRSPNTGDVDYGLVIRPRFQWRGIGEMLGTTGWQVIPDLLKIPKLPQSDRRVPPWVLSSVVLRRLDGLLENLTREFRHEEEVRRRPAGRINWERYASRSMPRGKMLDVPSSRPKLQADEDLKSAIRFTLKKQLRSLESQRSAGHVVLQLIERCRTMLEEVADVPARMPRDAMMRRWVRGPLKSDVFQHGLEAIEWTVDERGLAGLGDLSGIPWRMSMAEFFESWVESIAREVVTHLGGKVRVARRAETTTPIRWEPPFLGSQNSLQPDVVIDQRDRTIVFDAKYKSHWEEIEQRGWRNLRDDLRSRHRTDLLQALAYGNLPQTEDVTVCLVYPCRADTWNSLKERGRTAHTADISTGRTQLSLLLAAVPMAAKMSDIVEVLANWLEN